MNKKYRELIDFVQDKDVFVLDFDGTIANTEPAHWVAQKKYAKSYGATITDDMVKAFAGGTDKALYEAYKELFVSKDTFRQYMEKKTAMFFDELVKTNLQPFEYLFELIKARPDARYCILTNNFKDIVNKCLDIWGIRKRFSTILAVGNARKNKFELIAELDSLLKVEKSRIVIFDDVEKYIKADIQAGYPTIFIKGPFNAAITTSANITVQGVNKK